jgi:hypothetical protein
MLFASGSLGVQARMEQNLYLIPINNLEKGDILLTSERSATSNIVRKGTDSHFSHAILYVGAGSYIHSDLNGVHSGNLQRLLFDLAENVNVLRIECSSEIIYRACMFARDKIGTQYSVKSAINTTLKLSKKENKNRQFCSRLVVQAYSYAGIELVDIPSFCTPQEILDSKFTREISGLTRQASAEEIRFANSENPIEYQSRITNEILSKVRGVSNQDIQTLPQITQYVIDNPQYDKEISNIYKESGYLTMWSDEIEENLWRYDGRIFINIPLPKSELIEQAKLEKESAIEILDHYKINLEIYTNLNEIYNLEYSRIHFELYKNIVENTLNRLNAAEFVLKNT